MIKKTILISLFTLFITSLGAQQLFYSDIIYGGVTGNGLSSFGGTANFSIKIPPNSTIVKAYLIAARDSLADDLTVSLNGENYLLDNSSIITNNFISDNNGSLVRSNSSLHVIDVTNDIDSSINNYNLLIPLQSNTPKGIYTSFYLYVAYQNFSFPIIACNLHLNVQDVAPVSNYHLSLLSPINNINHVALGMATTYFCDTIQDGSYIEVNGNNIGLIGGNDSSSWLGTCSSVWSNFSHYNDSLFGLDDDTPDSLMGGTDVLADIKSYVNNRDTNLTVKYTYQTLDNSNGGVLTNPVICQMLSYSTPCDTFSTQAMPLQDTICNGDSVLLQATGGSQYSWYGAFDGLSNPNIANPMASPSQTSTYICTITNDSGCVKTEHVKIWVNPLPKADTVRVTATSCGDSTGTLQVGSIANGSPPYTYTLSGVSSSYNEVQFIPNFTTLATGSYHLAIQDAKGCQWDTVLQIPEVNLTQVQFTANPMEGVKPLTVNFTNTSIGTTHYKWYVNGDSVSNTLDYVYTFNQAGTYLVSLVGYNNFSHCSDTFSIQVVVKDSLLVHIPQFISPNGDGKNDAWQVQIGGAKQVDVKMFNRWGSLVYTHQNPLMGGLQNHELWNGLSQKGKPVVSGTYFYVLVFTDNHGQTHPYTGFLEVRR